MFVFFKQKTAYEMRISDWSSDVCSSDLRRQAPVASARAAIPASTTSRSRTAPAGPRPVAGSHARGSGNVGVQAAGIGGRHQQVVRQLPENVRQLLQEAGRRRSEEHPSELQSLMRHSYAAFCLNKKKATKEGH